MWYRLTFDQGVEIELESVEPLDVREYTVGQEITVALSGVLDRRLRLTGLEVREWKPTPIPEPDLGIEAIRDLLALFNDPAGAVPALHREAYPDCHIDEPHGHAR